MGFDLHKFMTIAFLLTLLNLNDKDDLNLT